MGNARIAERKGVMTTRPWFALLAAAAAAAALLVLAEVPTGVRADEPWSLRFMNTGPVMGAVPPYFSRSPQRGNFGGMARVKTLFDQWEAEVGGRNGTLKVDMGRMIGTNLFDQFWSGEPAREVAGEFGMRATTLGLEDLYGGLDRASRHFADLAARGIPMVMSNMRIDSWHPLHALLHPYVLLDVVTREGGVKKIGLVAMVGEEFCLRTSCSEGGAEIQVLDALPAVAEARDAAYAAGADTVFCLVSSVFSYQDALAEVVPALRRIPFYWVTTGLLANHGGEQLAHNPVEGPQPMVAQDADGKDVLLVGPGQYTTYPSYNDVTFQDNVHTAASGETITAQDCANARNDTCVAEDPGMAARVQVWNAAVDEWRSESIGVSKEELDQPVPQCRFMECDAATLVADAVRWKVSSSCDVAWSNSGGTRTPADGPTFPVGTITVGHVLAALPFSNAISSFKLRGEHILDALRHSVSRVPPRSNLTLEAYTHEYLQGGTGNFMNVAGLRFQFDPSNPAGSRVQRVEIEAKVPGTQRREWGPLSRNKIYDCCTTDFIRGGGDGYSVFRDEAVEAHDFGPSIQSAVIGYFERFSPVDHPAMGRINVTDSGSQLFYCQQGCEQGTCVEDDQCNCFAGWTGADCSVEVVREEASNSWIAYGVPIIVVFLGAVCGGAFWMLRQQRKRHIQAAAATENKYAKVIEFAELQIGHQIGEGTFGIISWGLWRGTEVAIKEMKNLDGAGAGGGTIGGGGTARGASQGADMSAMPEEDKAFFTQFMTNYSTAVSKRSTGPGSTQGSAKTAASSQAEEFHEEIGLMCSLRHPNVLLYMGTTRNPLCLVTEFMAKGSLASILANRALAVPWGRRISLAADTAKGLLYLHEHTPPILHMDLKAANVLVDSNWNGKLCDFGLTHLKGGGGGGGGGEQSRKNTKGAAQDAEQPLIGTLLFMAPEIMTDGFISEKCDVFSYGIFLYELGSRELPYREQLVAGQPAAAILVQVATAGLRPAMPADKMPKGWAELASDCWAHDRSARPAFGQVVTAIGRFSAAGLTDEEGAAGPEDTEQLRDRFFELQGECEKLRATVATKDKEIARLKDLVQTLNASGGGGGGQAQGADEVNLDDILQD